MSKHRPILGPAAMGGLAVLRGASSLIKSVQRGTIAVTGATSVAVTIAPVDLANARLRFLGCTASVSAVDGQKYFARLSLTATTVTATVVASPGANTCTVGYEVTEYLPGVFRSIQRGTMTPNGGSATVTITEVDPSKSELSYLGTDDQDSANNNGILPTLALTNGTTVTGSNVIAGNATVAFEVAEYF